MQTVNKSTSIHLASTSFKIEIAICIVLYNSALIKLIIMADASYYSELAK